MKKWLFCLITAVCVFSVKPNNAKADVLKDIISYALGCTFGDKCHELIAKKLFGCDNYEKVGLLDSATHLASKNKKSKVCAANTVLKSAAKVVSNVSLLSGNFVVGVPAKVIEYVVAAIPIAMKYKDARYIAHEKYEVCLNEDPKADGRPLPYTDSQIVKLLKLAGELPTIGNITDKYDKMCIHEIGTDRYHFLKKDTTFDGLYITHMTGYAYVYCAHAYNACPCIYNVQGGDVEEPEYETDDETGVIKVGSDGEFIFKGDTDKSHKNRDKYQQNYAKHCRIIRYQDLYEQSNDVLPVFGDACYDMKGFSKTSVPLTSAFVQCIEDTAKNIFEKPIFNSKKVKTNTNDNVSFYEQDIAFIAERYEALKTLVQDRTIESIQSGEDVPFRLDELKSGLEILKALYYTSSKGAFQTYSITYECQNDKDGKYNENRLASDIYTKYLDPVNNSKYVTANCCSSDGNINTPDSCFTNKINDNYGGSFNTAILKNTTSITADTLIKETNKIENLINAIAVKRTNANLAASLQVPKVGYLNWTLFDVFRNKIKVLAVVALTLWFFILGWKLLNGDLGKTEPKDMFMMVMKVCFCFFIVFNDNAKNYLFTFMINTTNGIGQMFNSSLQGLRSQKDNAFGGKCNFTLQQDFSPTMQIVSKIQATRIENGIKYGCDKWQKLITFKNNKNELNIPEEYILTKNGNSYTCLNQELDCKTKGLTFKCNEYYKNINDIETSYCKSGQCTIEGGITIKNDVYLKSLNTYAKPKEVMTYDFQCPMSNYELTCDKDGYDYYGNCIKKTCNVLGLTCNQLSNQEITKTKVIDDNGEEQTQKIYDNEYNEYTTSDGAGLHLACSRYDRNPFTGELLNNCLQGNCRVSRGDFIPRPNFERPYKIHEYYSYKDKQFKGLKPHCHKVATPNIINDDGRKKMYSLKLNDYIWVCTHKDTEMDAGYRLRDLIDIGLVDGDDESVKLFSDLLTEEQRNLYKYDLVNQLKEMVIPTAVALPDNGGIIHEMDFTSGGGKITGYQRFKYSKYLTSRLNYVNAGSQYPVFKKYGLTRNYSHISMWDMVDCKFMQYLTFSTTDNAFGENIEQIMREAQSSGNVKGKNVVNGFINMMKMLVIAFPFGAICFIISFIIALILFFLIARAAQQYAVCVFNLICVMYLSPFVATLWLYEQTKKSMESWLNDIRQNIIGACIPFVSISIFLVIVDWAFFGDPLKYKTHSLFLSNGTINPNCYDGHLSDAPIACLSSRLMDKYSLNGNILNMLTGVLKQVIDGTPKLALYLVIKSLIAAAVMVMLAMSLDKMEQKMYELFCGGKPDTDIGAGFEGSAQDAFATGASTGWSIYKNFALAPIKGAFKKIKSAFNEGNSGTGNGGTGSGGGIFGSLMKMLGIGGGGGAGGGAGGFASARRTAPDGYNPNGMYNGSVNRMPVPMMVQPMQQYAQNSMMQNANAMSNLGYSQPLQQGNKLLQQQQQGGALLTGGFSGLKAPEVKAGLKAPEVKAGGIGDNNKNGVKSGDNKNNADTSIISNLTSKLTEMNSALRQAQGTGDKNKTNSNSDTNETTRTSIETNNIQTKNVANDNKDDETK